MQGTFFYSVTDPEGIYLLKERRLDANRLEATHLPLGSMLVALEKSTLPGSLTV